MSSETNPNGSGDLTERTPEVQAAYEQARRDFTEADLQKYFEPEEGVPLAKLLEELEAIQRQETAKRAGG